MFVFDRHAAVEKKRGKFSNTHATAERGSQNTHATAERGSQNTHATAERGSQNAMRHETHNGTLKNVEVYYAPRCFILAPIIFLLNAKFRGNTEELHA